MTIRHTRKQWADLREQDKKAAQKRVSRAEKKRLGEVGSKSGNFVPRLQKALRRREGAE